jgi:glycosyltransferase involved in cell wall biosynthesis
MVAVGAEASTAAAAGQNGSFAWVLKFGLTNGIGISRFQKSSACAISDVVCSTTATSRDFRFEFFASSHRDTTEPAPDRGYEDQLSKILFIAANEGVPWGGSEHCWAAAAERLVKTGADVHISVKRWDKPVPQIEKLRAAGCHITHRTYKIPPLPVRLVRKLWPQGEYAFEHLRRIANGTDLIVVSQGWHFDGLPWLEAAHSLGHKYAVICEGVSEHWWPSDEQIERLAAAWEGAVAAFFVSEHNLDLTRRMFLSPLPHARVVRNPFNVRYDVSIPWPENPAQLSLAFVSRLKTVAKGYDLLIQVLSLPHWRERNIRVSLFGDGPNERSLRRAVQQAGLANIYFSGFSDSIEQIWTDHHALILPSRSEGMPLVLVDAMLCGRPAIATAVGGIPELLRDDRNGFLAKAPTVECLDDAMNRAWENRHRLKQMGQQAAADVRKLVPPQPTEDFLQQLRALTGFGISKAADFDEQFAQPATASEKGA